MPKPSTPAAVPLTADVVLELGKYQQADDLRKLQTKLTSTAREIRNLTSGNKLLGRIGGMLTDEQQQLLRDAAKLIESVGFNIEHAKEKRQRTEAQIKSERKERDAAAKKIAASAYSLATETLEQQLEIIWLALTLSRAGCYQPFYSPTEISLRFRNYVCARPRLFGWKSAKEYWDSRIRAFADELREEIELYLTVDDGQCVRQRLEDLQSKAREHRPEVCSDPYEVETLRMWAALLAGPQQQGAGQ